MSESANELVFSVRQYIKDRRKEDEMEGCIFALRCGWPRWLDGKTYEEIRKIGLGTHEDWMIPSNEFEPITELEIEEVLK